MSSSDSIWSKLRFILLHSTETDNLLKNIIFVADKEYKKLISPFDKTLKRYFVSKKSVSTKEKLFYFE